MKVLIIGGGGREHAIGYYTKQNPSVSELFFAPGNGGTQAIGTNIVAATVQELCLFAKENDIALTIVGSEALLVEGIVDCFQKEGLPIFGPNKASAQLEGNKTFAKDFMRKYGIKTADYKNFNDYKTAKAYLNIASFPIVIKASGLAAGKGVFIAQNLIEAEQTLEDLMENKKLGLAGSSIVIESYLEGVEASILSVFDGSSITPFISAKDHKKIGANETGPNTGGMGVIAPNPHLNQAHWDDFLNHILNPTLEGLKQESLAFCGVIFFGLMLTKQGVYLLEYNLRMGDPETQAVLPLLNTDFLEIIQSALAGKTCPIAWKQLHSCCVVMASGGYPDAYQKDKPIYGLPINQALCFVAGATQDPFGALRTSSGRVLSVVATALNPEQARKKAYEALQNISFEDAYYRSDIGL